MFLNGLLRVSIDKSYLVGLPNSLWGLDNDYLRYIEGDYCQPVLSSGLIKNVVCSAFIDKQSNKD